MNQMNQIGINKQQKTQNNTKNKFRDIREIRWQKITHCASHLVHPVRLVIKTKKRFVFFVSSVGKKNRC